MNSLLRKIKKQGKRFYNWAKNNRKQFFILCGVSAFLFFVGIPVFTYAYFAKDLGSKESIITRNEAGVTLLDRHDKPFYTLYDAKNRDYVPLDQISKNLQEAVIAAEDRDFYEHPGFSIKGIGRAFISNLQSGGISQGASTIPQQLVKNVLLSQDRNYLRKFQEVVLAIEIDRRYSKDDILEMYLNAVYFGESSFGAQQAAEVYFGKNASELTIAEAAMLAGLLPAPSAYSPISGSTEKAYQRQKTVLKLMKDQGFITEAQRKAAEKEKLEFSEEGTDINVIAPHLALMVKDFLIDKYGEKAVAQSGFRVQTTIDLEWQKFAQKTVQDQIAALTRNKATNGALVAIDPKNGQVVALVGSHKWSDEDNGKINMAVRPRQPGSSFKPLVFATAMEEKSITAGTVLEDKVKDFGGGYKPTNYDFKERGEVTVRRALANSLNIPAVEVMQKVGVPKMLDKAEDIGITTLDSDVNYGLSLVLGSGEVPLVQMTNAFAAFANEGENYTPTIILQIRDKKDRVVYKGESKAKRAFTSEVSFIISSILSDASARAEVFGNALNTSIKTAVKTGTTNDYKDALTIGYTPNIVVGVWVGNNDNKPMDTVAGSLGAAPIWRKVIERIAQDQSSGWFSKPMSVSDMKVCAEKGLKLDDVGDAKDGEKTKVKEGDSEVEVTVLTEYYIRGTEPDKKCFPESPTPDPTREAEDKKKREEEEKKRKDEEDKKNSPTARPSSTVAPTVKPTEADEDDDPKPSTSPTNTGSPVSPTTGTSPAPTSTLKL